MKEVALGKVEEFSDLPKKVEIERTLCYLLKEEETYHLVSRMCPHAGALVEAEDGELVCYMHGWSFDIHNGACLNVPGKRLTEYKLIVRDGELIAQLEK